VAHNDQRREQFVQVTALAGRHRKIERQLHGLLPGHQNPADRRDRLRHPVHERRRFGPRENDLHPRVRVEHREHVQ
jgi:hypothetical protein